MMISVLTLHLIPVPSGNRRAFNLRGRAGNVEFVAALFLRLRIVPSFRAILSWHGWIERQQWKISENLWKIRQTTNLDCNHGNKPAVTFNCTIFPRFLFSISQSCFSNCLIAMSLSLFGFVVDDDADKREMESPWTKVEARRMKNLKRIDDVCVWIGRRKDKRKQLSSNWKIFVCNLLFGSSALLPSTALWKDEVVSAGIPFWSTHYGFVPKAKNYSMQCQWTLSKMNPISVTNINFNTN